MEPFCRYKLTFLYRSNSPIDMPNYIEFFIIIIFVVRIHNIASAFPFPSLHHWSVTARSLVASRYPPDMHASDWLKVLNQEG